MQLAFATNQEHPDPPVDVFQLGGNQLRGTQAGPGDEQQHGVVASTDGIIQANRIDHALDASFQRLDRPGATALDDAMCHGDADGLDDSHGQSAITEAIPSNLGAESSGDAPIKNECPSRVASNVELHQGGSAIDVAPMGWGWRCWLRMAENCNRERFILITKIDLVHRNDYGKAGLYRTRVREDSRLTPYERENFGEASSHEQG